MQIVIPTASDSDIIVIEVFVADSAAKGVFVVLQSEDDGSGDEFRAVLREGQGDSAITVPPSTYTLLVYDLEENALPSENVAFTSSEKITVENGNSVYTHKHVYILQ